MDPVEVLAIEVKQFVGEGNGLFEVLIFIYRNLPRREGLTVEQSLASLGRGVTADIRSLRCPHFSGLVHSLAAP
jgi:hypothetical protein